MPRLHCSAANVGELLEVNPLTSACEIAKIVFTCDPDNARGVADAPVLFPMMVMVASCAIFASVTALFVMVALMDVVPEPVMSLLSVMVSLPEPGPDPDPKLSTYERVAMVVVSTPIVPLTSVIPVPAVKVGWYVLAINDLVAMVVVLTLIVPLLSVIPVPVVKVGWYALARNDLVGIIEVSMLNTPLFNMIPLPAEFDAIGWYVLARKDFVGMVVVSMLIKPLSTIIPSPGDDVSSVITFELVEPCLELKLFIDMIF